MAETLLSIQLSDIAGRVGHNLGFGRTPANWTGWQAATPYVASGPDTQLDWVMECVQAGYRRFLYPILVDEGPVAYEWSFLTPNKQFQLVAAQTTYDMPDDFQDLVGEFTFQIADNSWQQVRETGIGEVKRWLQQAQGLSTFPQICAIFPKPSDGTQGQRMGIQFAPIPDKPYLLDGRWTVLPGPLTATNPFPYGGAEHGETIIASALAVAEVRFKGETNGPFQQDFKERLRASIALDREAKPEFFGYNSDRSDLKDQAWPYYPAYGTVVSPPLHNGAPW